MLIKKDILTQGNKNFQELLSYFSSEITAGSEWSIFDDTNILNKGSWLDVIK
jgi:hypothetical protein